MILSVTMTQAYRCDGTILDELLFASFVNSLKDNVKLYALLALKLKKKICIFPAECICVFSMVVTINSDCFPKQH
jgi:hypothetical protein